MPGEEEVTRILESTKFFHHKSAQGVALPVPFEDGMLSIRIEFSVLDVRKTYITVWKCERVDEDGCLFKQECGYCKFDDRAPGGPMFPSQGCYDESRTEGDEAVARVIASSGYINGNPLEGVAMAVPFEGGMLCVRAVANGQREIDVTLWKCASVGADGTPFGKEYGYMKKMSARAAVEPISPA
jgi:hypothetical protein